jgi:hypothetical protein
MNFASEELPAFSFRESFLVGSTFEESRLPGASFAAAFIRNVNFAGADLSDADFTDADWFNSQGLTQDQLKSIRPGTLMPCPGSVAGMRRHLEARYEFPLASWSSQVQAQLRSAWTEYLRPGGLRDFLTGLGGPAL